MTGSRRSLWLLWALFLGMLCLEPLLARHLPVRAIPWHGGQAAVAGFVLALAAIALGVWTFALREALALRDVRAGRLDPHTPEGLWRMRAMLLALWAFCLLPGLLGSVLAWGSGTPQASWPYVLGGGALLLLHAPRDRLFRVPRGEAVA
jgi:hypothetical protein